ncbi:MAG: hypothetical protein MHM6MM_001857 [Cercozoa sp. M6MM]
MSVERGEQQQELTELQATSAELAKLDSPASKLVQAESELGSGSHSIEARHVLKEHAPRDEVRLDEVEILSDSEDAEEILRATFPVRAWTEEHGLVFPHEAWPDESAEVVRRVKMIWPSEVNKRDSHGYFDHPFASIELQLRRAFRERNLTISDAQDLLHVVHAFARRPISDIADAHLDELCQDSPEKQEHRVIEVSELQQKPFAKELLELLGWSKSTPDSKSSRDEMQLAISDVDLFFNCRVAERTLRALLRELTTDETESDSASKSSSDVTAAVDNADADDEIEMNDTSETNHDLTDQLKEELHTTEHFELLRSLQRGNQDEQAFEAVAISPDDTVDFGLVRSGSVYRRAITLRNVSKHPLRFRACVQGEHGIASSRPLHSRCNVWLRCVTRRDKVISPGLQVPVYIELHALPPPVSDEDSRIPKAAVVIGTSRGQQWRLRVHATVGRPDEDEQLSAGTRVYSRHLFDPVQAKLNL